MSSSLRRALVCFSGGQDSTTCLYWALSQFDEVEAIGFDYGQRHAAELEAAETIAAHAGVPYLRLPVSALGALGGNSLTDPEVAVSDERNEDGLPTSFVPGRNLLFLTLAAARAYQRACLDLVTGVCQTDYSGYPDCRRETMDALERTLSLGIGRAFIIHTPLMELTKAETVRMAAALPGCLEALAESHTCYRGERPPCGDCDACLLRAKGFAEAGIDDPIVGRPAPAGEGPQRADLDESV